MEACVALDMDQEALSWAVKYLKFDNLDAFEYASTERQLREVWQLDLRKPELGQALVSMLNTAQLKRVRAGGRVDVDRDTLKITQAASNNPVLLHRLATEGFKHTGWIRRGEQAKLAVAKIDGENALAGTGFLLPAEVFWSNADRAQLVFVTTANFLQDGQREAKIRFAFRDAADTQLLSHPLTVKWRSTDLDIAIASFGLGEGEGESDALPLSLGSCEKLDRNGKESRLIVIDHAVGDAQIAASTYDCDLLSFDDSTVYYRSPTEHVSEGSPVFDDDWNLIAIHTGRDKSIRANRARRIDRIQHVIREETKNVR
jgi:hypothetical protein